MAVLCFVKSKRLISSSLFLGPKDGAVVCQVGRGARRGSFWVQAVREEGDIACGELKKKKNKNQTECQSAFHARPRLTLPHNAMKFFLQGRLLPLLLLRDPLEWGGTLTLIK